MYICGGVGARRDGRAGFTLLELVVVMAILAVIASILLSALAKAMMKVRETQCKSNLRQIGLIATTYADEQDNVVMPSVFVEAGGAEEIGWANYVANNTELNQEQLFVCPSFAPRECYTPYEYDSGGHRVIPRCSYVMNTIAEGGWGNAAISSLAVRSSGWGSNSQNPIKIQSVQAPHSKIYMLDALPRPATYTSLVGWNSDLTGIVHWKESDHGFFPTTAAGANYRDVGVHHNWGFNVIFGDTHVEWMRDGASQPDQWVVRVR